MKTLHEQLKELEEKAEKIGLHKDRRFNTGWHMPLEPNTKITLGSQYDARIKKLMKMGVEKNIHPEYLERWAKNKYDEIDWEKHQMLHYQEKLNLFYKITELEDKLKGEENEKDNLRQT
tara:strand:- start:168 stop:524 length:357 start_codon:yes stop_codon:yes gene_type:complete